MGLRVLQKKKNNPNFVCLFPVFGLLGVFAGCCFVICPSRQEADKAVNACHNKKTLPGVSGTWICLWVTFISLQS